MEIGEFVQSLFKKKKDFLLYSNLPACITEIGNLLQEIGEFNKFLFLKDVPLFSNFPTCGTEIGNFLQEIGEFNQFLFLKESYYFLIFLLAVQK